MDTHISKAFKNSLLYLSNYAALPSFPKIQVSFWCYLPLELPLTFLLKQVGRLLIVLFFLRMSLFHLRLYRIVFAGYRIQS